MKKKILIIAIVMCIATSLFLVACNDNSTDVKKFQVSFDTNGGSEVVAQTIEKSKNIEVEPVTTKNGYSFKGWFADSSFAGSRITFPYVVDEDTTLYAKWEEQIMVSVIFFSNNDETSQELAVAVGDSINEPTSPTKTDYTFLGWFDSNSDNANQIVFPYIVAQDDMSVISFHAKWKLNVATLKFVTNCNVKIDDKRVNVGESIKLDKMSREGYNFSGWYESKNFSGSAIEDNYAPTANVTLYAKWEKITYIITFDTDGYPIENKTIDFGDDFKAGIPCRNESVFEGWYDNKDFAGDPLTFPYAPTANVTLYAKWSASTANSHFSFQMTSTEKDYIIKKAEGIDLPAEVVIPDSYFGLPVTDIAKNAFANSNALQKVWIGENVTKISDEAFMNCASLTNVYMKNSIISIGQSAFEGCSSLTEFTMPKNLTYISDWAFKDCTSLIKVVLPDGINAIGNSAFQNCIKLSDINLENSIEYINSRAFYGCASLESVTLPTNLKELKESVFTNCTALNSIYFHKRISDIQSNILSGCTKLQTITIEADCEKYRSENNSIIDIANQTLIIACNGTDKIADGIKKIEGGAFNNLDIVSVTLPSSIEEIEFPPFSDCLSLESVVIEFDIDILSGFRLSNIFDNAPALKSVELKAGTEIPRAAFFDLKQITNIVIPSTTKIIEESAFQNCEGLQSIVLPEGLETIGQFAFGGCKGLTNFTLPSTFKTLDNTSVNIFQKCINMKILTILATTPPRLDFYEANWRLEKIRVPSASLASYQGDFTYSSYTLEGI